ncbi:MAG TPA: ribokinase [Terracidiphilus sp.]|nr:ribokinase [Terracidiphilus sp.]
MSPSSGPIVVVGSVTMDMVSRAPEIPRVGQTVIGTSFQTTPGGKGANQAVAAARLGYPVRMIGMVGDDVYGPALLRNLAEAGVDTAQMGLAHGSSGLAPIFLSAAGENSIIVIPGANGHVTPAFVDEHREVLATAGLVLCQLELPMATLNHTLAVCAELGVPVMLDPAPAAELENAVWGRVAWFTPNETEASFYLKDGADAAEAAQELLERGLGGVVLKRGAEGAYVAGSGGEARLVPGFAVDAIDTVGAGDCFNGAFAVALLEGRDPWEAARFANAAAALSVTRSGAQAAMPTRQQVEALLAGEIVRSSASD